MANGKVLGQNHITQHFENAIKMTNEIESTLF